MQDQQSVSKIYQYICVTSETGRRRGCSIKELKKEFHLKNRDIVNLISFLNNYGSANVYSRFDIYRLTDHYMSQKDQKESLIFEALDDDDVNYPDIYIASDDPDDDDSDLSNDDDMEYFDPKTSPDNTYIRIEDFSPMLEKLLIGDVDLTNAAFIHNLPDDIASISDFKMSANYIVLKEEHMDRKTKVPDKKMNWILAVVTNSMVSIAKITNPQTLETVLPLGMYYNKFLDKYYCVYQKDEKKYQELALDEISKLETLDDKHGDDVHFNIDKYIKHIQKVQIVLRVYKEANVAEKLKKLLSDNQLSVKEGELYDIFTFMVKDAQQYIKTLKSYGKSVIVMEPADIRQEIIESTNEALNFYQKSFES